jgi:hypothetical protein
VCFVAFPNQLALPNASGAALGLATATTSAAFFPHCEQRNRGARSSSIIDQPIRRARASTALADHSHQELAEAIVQSLDVSEHAHARMVRICRAQASMQCRRAFRTVRAARASSGGGLPAVGGGIGGGRLQGNTRDAQSSLARGTAQLWVRLACQFPPTLPMEITDRRGNCAAATL